MPMTTAISTMHTEAVANMIGGFRASATRMIRALVARTQRSKWWLLLTIVAGAVLGVLVVKLIALLAAVFDLSLLRDVGSNAGPSAGAGGAGAGAGAQGAWPGPNYYWDSQSKSWQPFGAPSGGGGQGSGGGGGGGGGGGSDGTNSKPWWQNLIPSSWTNIGAGPVSIDTTTGRTSVGGSVNLPDGVTVSGKADFGATATSDPHAPFADMNYNVSVQTPVGTVGVQGTATVGISQQVQQNVSGPMGSQGTQSGAAVNDFLNSGN